MTFLLDTNLISEWTEPKPDMGVIEWLAEADEDRLFISIATLAELRFGVERLPAGARRKRLDAWLSDELPARFEGRVLAIDSEIAHTWGQLMARAQAAGRTVGAMDGFIAATAACHDLTLVTRNIGDFEGLGVRLENPWRGG